MSFVDVSLDYPVLVTDRVTMQVDAQAEPTTPITGALVIDVGLFRYPGANFVVTGALRGWGADWEVEPALAVRVWDAGLDAGIRWGPEPGSRALSGWWDVGSGLRTSVLTADWWDSVVAPGVGVHTGFGAVAGRGRVRLQTSVRFDAALRFDSWTGTVMASEGTVAWSWWPGSARLSALAGVQVP